MEKPPEKAKLLAYWPIIVSLVTVAAVFVQTVINERTSGATQEFELRRVRESLDKIDARIEKMDNRVSALEATVVQSNAEFRVQIDGLKEDLSALILDWRNLRSQIP